MEWSNLVSLVQSSENIKQWVGTITAEVPQDMYDCNFLYFSGEKNNTGPIPSKTEYSEKQEHEVRY